MAAHDLNVENRTYSISDLKRDFSDKKKIKECVGTIRWGNMRICPRCGSTRTTELDSGKPMSYYCPDCRRAGRPKYFSVTTGTRLESTGLDWEKILHSVYFLAAQHEGISASQLAEYVGIDESTALVLRYKVHADLPDEVCHLFSGPTEVDESYVGGSETKRHRGDRQDVRGRQGKLCVLGAVDRATGHVRLSHAEKGDTKTILDFVHSVAKLWSKVFTDGYCVYQKLEQYLHQWVNHGAGEYARGEVHINTAENLFDRLDRALYPLRGVSKERLPGYLCEIQWLRNLTDRPVLVRMGVILSYLLCAETHEAGSTDQGPASAAESADDTAQVQSLPGANGDGTTLLGGADQQQSMSLPATTAAMADPQTARRGGKVRRPRSPVERDNPYQGKLLHPDFG